MFGINQKFLQCWGGISSPFGKIHHPNIEGIFILSQTLIFLAERTPKFSIVIYCNMKTSHNLKICGPLHQKKITNFQKQKVNNPDNVFLKCYDLPHTPNCIPRAQNGSPSQPGASPPDPQSWPLAGLPFNYIRNFSKCCNPFTNNKCILINEWLWDIGLCSSFVWTLGH